MKNLVVIICSVIVVSCIYAVDRSQDLIQAVKAGTLTEQHLTQWHHEDPRLRGDIALMHAAKSGNIRLVRMLLNIPNFADTRALDSQAFRWAVAGGHAEVANLLLNRGAQLHAVDDESLVVAATNRYPQTLLMLLMRSALPGTQPFSRETITELMQQLSTYPQMNNIVELLRGYRLTL